MGYRGSRGAKLIPAKIKRMPNGRYKVFVAPSAVARMHMNPSGMKTYELYWSPTGEKIAEVTAKTKRAAVRKAPYPYRRYLGEIYAKEL